VKNILFFGGYYALHKVIRGTNEKRLLILMYHDFYNGTKNEIFSRLSLECPSKKQFAAHLRVIKRYYRVITVEDAMREIDHEGGLREDSVAITIDDGYASAYTVAYPLLKEYQIPATIYLMTDWINDLSRPWWLTLAELCAESDFRGVQPQELLEIFEFDRSLVCPARTNTPNWRKWFFRVAEQYLRMKESSQCRTILSKLGSLVSKSPPDTCSLRPSLSWVQVQEMRAGGITFGAHTASHPNLSHSTPDEAETEIVKSKEDIENRIDQPVRGFAYPYGVDLMAYKGLYSLLAKHQFSYAVTAAHGNNTPDAHRYLLRRVTLSNSTSTAILGRELCLDLLATNHEPAERAEVI